MSILCHMADLKSGIKSRRVSSFDIYGGNGDFIYLPANETYTVADICGCGIIRHLWFTHTNEVPEDDLRQNVILRIYWDGSDKPQVETPLGAFFGQGFGGYHNTFALPVQGAPSAGSALVSYFPMPFRKGARITLENKCPHQIRTYFYVDYERREQLSENDAYFHARKLSREDGYRLEIAGCGQIVGVNLFVEGLARPFSELWNCSLSIDGKDGEYDLCGPGFFFAGDGWNINGGICSGVIAHPPSKAGLKREQYYRFLLDAPIRFNESLSFSVPVSDENLEIVWYWYSI